MKRPTFYWGVGLEDCWMAEHDEQRLAPQITISHDFKANRQPKRLLDTYLLMQHYTMWREDLDRAAALGVNAIRYTVPWYRANPKPGVYDWSWISKSLEYLVNDLKITPIIDLLHYGTPVWMQNSTLNHDYPQRFAEYAAAFARQFKGLVNHYTPHNEPHQNVVWGGYAAIWPPYLIGVDGWLKVGMNVARGMVLVTQALRSELPDCTIISADGRSTMPPSEVEQDLCIKIANGEREEFDLQVMQFPSNLAYGKVTAESPLGRGLIRGGESEISLAWFRDHAELPDVLGLFYYPGCFGEPGSDSKDAIDNSIMEMVAQISSYANFVNRPIYLMETSGGNDDTQKIKWMNAVIKGISILRDCGINVTGVNWWPLFEVLLWQYREDTRTVFESIRRCGWNNGLYLIEEEFDGTLKRVPTASIDAYRSIIKKYPEGPFSCINSSINHN